MGIQLNIGDHHPWFSEFVAIPGNLRADAQWARAQAKAIANTKPSANAYFRTLPGHRTLSALLADGKIWVNYYNGSGTAMGMRYDNEIGISYWSFYKGKNHVLGTLIHELAHINGAPDETFQAENALVHCGLGTLSELNTGVDDQKTPFVPGTRG